MSKSHQTLLRTASAGRVTLDSVIQKSSPHFDARPDPTDISLLVIHNISLPAGEFSTPYVDRLFMGCIESSCPASLQELIGLRVSAHLFIDRQGVITQYVNLLDRAWHAGVSEFEGRSRCNDFSIGIELEGTDSQPYEEAQYHSLDKVTRHILDKFPKITLDRIVGHEHIAPGRKTDPGEGFDWRRYLSQLQSLPD
ncbi:1,6-anhydro-N-acetylmuramyl-L-alanine amidase AmpD [Paraferrimonas haliotis]|uniref:1,6-anhydro-N-acetylmuramyl-L-alanine amidase AmpD n=1 Tax=Paraferrimonas haliotis TaxID=2013866 RepID=A0AA37WVM1_9GAMM|nr:1,6-anhydro-N-acetylmuramyl-L-alanine amidase AmpD [Paraferrimonas haliotis]GLS82262.1 1,6-anhydro-N-acetylmuramyl-L-alanine amidase AmpD [Paraferrimonas haliotis]